MKLFTIVFTFEKEKSTLESSTLFKHCLIDTGRVLKLETSEFGEKPATNKEFS